MNVLVLGGNGFIGSHVVDALLVAGHRLRVLGHAPELYRAPLAGVDYISGDFADESLLAEALEGMDAVCHLISTTVPATSNLDPVADVQSNLVNTIHLLEQMRLKNIRRIFYLSSGGTVYGNPQYSPVDENHPLHPLCSYAVVKLAIENYLFMYQQLHGFEPIVLRASNPYGPRQGHAGVQGLIGTFLSRLATGEAVEIWGDGKVIRDYIYIGDLAELCVKSLQSDCCGVFNAGSGVGHSVNDIVGVMREEINADLQVNYRDGRDFDVKEIVLDMRHTCNTFAWQPQTDLRAGLQEHWRWLQALSYRDL